MADNQSIVESPLFQSVAPHITSITREQLFLAFRGLKAQKIRVNWRAEDIGAAFSWDSDLIKGSDFWGDLHNEYRHHEEEEDGTF
jgi:hypothetical protein